jgi:hypothetical protein
MTLTAEDYVDIGTLIGFAVQPTARPGNKPDYRRVLARYRSEVEFKDAADAVLHGLRSEVLSDSDHGLILGVLPDSPFAFKYSDLPYTGKRQHRLVAGLVLTAVAAFVFPTPAELDDDRVRRVNDIEFEQWLRETCEQLRHHNATGEEIPDDGLDEAWRHYVAMPAAMRGERGRGSGRLTNGCTLYWVRACIGWLTDQGMAREDTTSSSANSMTWTLTERFWAHVRDMAANTAYETLADVARGVPRTQGHDTPPGGGVDDQADESGREQTA